MKFVAALMGLSVCVALSAPPLPPGAVSPIDSPKGKELRAATALVTPPVTAPPSTNLFRLVLKPQLGLVFKTNVPSCTVYGGTTMKFTCKLKLTNVVAGVVQPLKHPCQKTNSLFLKVEFP